MTVATRVDAIQRKTIRFTWTEGPTKGKTHEHVFGENGTVTWHDAASPPTGKPAEAPEYAAIEIADDIYLVSYLASSGYTLTVALNFRDHTIAGFASGAKDWYPVKGTLQVMG